MTSFQGKVAVVTGGNRGIGRGIADALAREGVAVALTARDAGAAAKAATEVGGGARGYACDVRRHEQVSELFDAAPPRQPIRVHIERNGQYAFTDLVFR